MDSEGVTGGSFPCDNYEKIFNNGIVIADSDLANSETYANFFSTLRGVITDIG